MPGSAPKTDQDSPRFVQSKVDAYPISLSRDSKKYQIGYKGLLWSTEARLYKLLFNPLRTIFAEDRFRRPVS